MIKRRKKRTSAVAPRHQRSALRRSRQTPGSQSDAKTASPLGNVSVVVVMGVSGCGKSTIASMLAQRLSWIFEEGD
jgi:adenylylsulfate kinase-like enzyme